MTEDDPVKRMRKMREGQTGQMLEDMIIYQEKEIGSDLSLQGVIDSIIKPEERKKLINIFKRKK